LSEVFIRFFSGIFVRFLKIVERIRFGFFQLFFRPKTIASNFAANLFDVSFRYLDNRVNAPPAELRATGFYYTVVSNL